MRTSFSIVVICLCASLISAEIMDQVPRKNITERETYYSRSSIGVVNNCNDNWARWVRLFLSYPAAFYLSGVGLANSVFKASNDYLNYTNINYPISAEYLAEMRDSYDRRLDDILAAMEDRQGPIDVQGIAKNISASIRDWVNNLLNQQDEERQDLDPQQIIQIIQDWVANLLGNNKSASASQIEESLNRDLGVMLSDRQGPIDFQGIAQNITQNIRDWFNNLVNNDDDESNRGENEANNLVEDARRLFDSVLDSIQNNGEDRQATLPTIRTSDLLRNSNSWAITVNNITDNIINPDKEPLGWTYFLPRVYRNFIFRIAEAEL